MRKKIMKTRLAAKTTKILTAATLFGALIAAPALAEEPKSNIEPSSSKHHAIAAPIPADEVKPTANASTGVYSQYIWRGWEESRDSIVIQPSITVSYYGVSVNLWANLDTNRYESIPGNSDPHYGTNDFNETDLTISYDGTAGKFLYGVGYIYYALDIVSPMDTQEIYAKLGVDTLLKPTLTVYRDIDQFPGYYFLVSVAHSLPLGDSKATLDLGARAGYYISDDEAFTEANSTEKYSALHDGVLSAGLTIPVSQYLTVSPQISYSFALSSKSKDKLKADNLATFGEDKSSFICGGITASLVF